MSVLPHAVPGLARTARWTIILSVGMFLAGAASAAEPDPVEAAIHRGVELRRRGDDAQALLEFTKAYDASRSPKALAQIGLAEQALGRWVAAETHLLGALDAKGEPWIEKNRPALQSAVETVSKHLGSLEVLGSPGEPRCASRGIQPRTSPWTSPFECRRAMSSSRFDRPVIGRSRGR
jgi:hypothetical protein